MKKLLVFPGTFNPFHNGHYLLLKTATTVENFDKVIISISKQNPFKETQPVSYEHRYQMAKLGLYELADQVIFDDFEANQNDVSYSYLLIDHLKQNYPEHEIYFLIGADNFATISQWKKIDTYFDQIHWLVAPRDNYEIQTKSNVSILNAPINDISSSMIRKQVRIVDMAPLALAYLNDYGIYGLERVAAFTSESRFAHILRVAEMTREIMEQYEPEHAHWGWTAGLYHDIAKTWNFDYQGLIGSQMLDMEFETPKILHGYIGAYMMKTQYLFTNQIILNAVARHTKPFDYYPPNTLTNLDMALYCADKLEPSRTEEDCQNIAYYRHLLKTNLEQCFNELYNAIQNQFFGK